LGYPRVFEKCLDVVGDYFEIDPAGTNRYAGIIQYEIANRTGHRAALENGQPITLPTPVSLQNRQFVIGLFWRSRPAETVATLSM
jgi:hypothetical protein